MPLKSAVLEQLQKIEKEAEDKEEAAAAEAEAEASSKKPQFSGFRK
jgi:hypothetical protein